MTPEETTELNRLRRKEIEERAAAQESAYGERFKDYAFWCSEGCGFVPRTHRCEQWSTVTAVSPALAEAIVARAKDA